MSDTERTNVQPATTILSKKSLISQIVACLGQNFLLLDLGLAITFSTVIITALLGAEGPMTFTKEQASWFGSISSIAQPIGSIVSGMMIEPLGRKMSLLVANLPHVVAWLMIYFSNNITMLFMANILLGLGIGLMEAPIITYVGEVSHPTVRGALTTISQVFITFGIFFAYLLGSVVDWRTAALISLGIPLITFIFICIIPETPVWLISKGRMDDAINALSWVRGWTKPEHVKNEFDELVIYQKNSVKCRYCTGPDTNDCTHQNIGLWQKMIYNYRNLTRKEMMRPLCLIMFLFLCQFTTAVNPTRPNMINIYKCFGFKIDSYLAVVITGAICVVTVFLAMFLIRPLGKRLLSLLTLSMCAISSLLIGLYAVIVLPHGISSYASIEFQEYEYSWMALTLFFVLNVSYFSGIGFIPWIMVSEVFPLSGRGIACGVSAAFAYVATSIAIKTYYNLETYLGLHGVFWYFGTCNIIGVIVLYFIMPETEGKSFEAIEEHFAKSDDYIREKWTNFFKYNRSNGEKVGVAGLDKSGNDKEMDVYKVVDSEKGH